MRWSSRSMLVVAGGARVGIGALLITRPAALPRTLGVDATTARAIAPLSAMLGARDALLGLGLLDALRRNADPRPWLAAAFLADSVDTLAFAHGTARRTMSPVAGGGSALLALSGVVAEGLALRELGRR